MSRSSMAEESRLTLQMLGPQAEEAVVMVAAAAMAVVEVATRPMAAVAEVTKAVEEEATKAVATKEVEATKVVVAIRAVDLAATKVVDTVDMAEEANTKLLALHKSSVHMLPNSSFVSSTIPTHPCPTPRMRTSSPRVLGVLWRCLILSSQCSTPFSIRVPAGPV